MRRLGEGESSLLIPAGERQRNCELRMLNFEIVERFSRNPVGVWRGE